MVTVGILPFRENSDGRAGNRTRDLMISSQRLWPLDHEACRTKNVTVVHLMCEYLCTFFISKCLFIYLFMIYCSDINIMHELVTNCFKNQFTAVSLWLFVYVRVKHLKVSALKNKYYIKNTAAAGVGFTIIGVWPVCVYIFHTASGDRVRYNSLFGKREGWGFQSVHSKWFPRNIILQYNDET